MLASRRVRILAALTAALAPAYGFCQSFNIDLDIFGGPPAGGNGAPSSAFGAAANQPGHWNRVSATGPTYLVSLADLVGNLTPVTIMASGSTGDAVGYNNPENTGDFALLLNDTADIGGPSIDYSFGGLRAGRYLVYTYAASGFPRFNRTEVSIAGAANPSLQVVTGPMPGNSFQYLITHSIHDVVVSDGSLVIHVTEVDPFGHVNGFQLMLVPEPSGTLALSALASMAVLRLRKRA